jgi:hypothetical protein
MDDPSNEYPIAGGINQKEVGWKGIKPSAGLPQF